MSDSYFFTPGYANYAKFMYNYLYSGSGISLYSNTGISFNLLSPKVVKKYFHSFIFMDRVITLCVASTDDGFVSVGYSVKLPEDKEDEELGKEIALGRAKKASISVEVIPQIYIKDRGILKAIARYWEREIRKDVNKYIKGIRDGNK